MLKIFRGILKKSHFKRNLMLKSIDNNKKGAQL